MSLPIYTVTVPQWQNSYQFSASTKVKYWEWKDLEKLPKKYKDLVDRHPKLVGKKAYCARPDGELFVKNPLKAGTPNLWILNGQALYSAVLNWRQRKSVAEYFHAYFTTYIKVQLSPIILNEGEYLSISCDIYEVQRGNMPDVSNMWLLEKFFEDALQECGIIPDDGPKYVIESGRKRYHWVNTAEERNLIFKIEVIQLS